MDKADRKTMLVHFDTWLTLTATMSDAQVGKLLRAAIAYARGEAEAKRALVAIRYWNWLSRC